MSSIQSGYATPSTSRFRNHTTNQQLTIACAMADAMLNPGSNLILAVDMKNDWGYNSGTGEEVAKRLSSVPLEPIEIYVYRPWNPWTKAIAFTTKGEFKIHFNCYKLDKLTVLEMASTILHETGHLAGYSHGNNFKTKEKCLRSVPYWLSENAWRFL